MRLLSSRFLISGADVELYEDSLYIFDLDDNFRIMSRERIVVDGRARDMIHLPGTQRYVLFLEGRPTSLVSLR